MKIGLLCVLTVLAGDFAMLVSGEIIIEQGEVGEYFYLIRSG
jgi:CRP-like cAMP-binding protein